MPPGLSPTHLLVIFVVALLVLGPDKMPEAIRKAARLLGEAREWSARISEEVQHVVSVQTEDVMASRTEPPTTPGGGDESTCSPPEPTTGAAPAPAAASAPSAAARAHVGPAPASSPPVGYLPLIPKEHT